MNKKSGKKVEGNLWKIGNTKNIEHNLKTLGPEMISIQLLFSIVWNFGKEIKIVPLFQSFSGRLYYSKFWELREKLRKSKA